MANNPQVPWTDEQWARVNQVVQEEARRSRVGASFLPLYGPLPASADFIRKEVIPGWDGTWDGPLFLEDRDTLKLATLEVRVALRSAQVADPDLNSAQTLFRRAAAMIARLEDSVIFRGLVYDPPGKKNRVAPPGGFGRVSKEIMNIHGGQPTDGLWGAHGAQGLIVGAPTKGLTQGDVFVRFVSEAIGKVEKDFHLGPFALVLDPIFFLDVQTPSPDLVLPQDRILPFLGGGPLLRTSTLPDNAGVLIALGGAPVELVVAQDLEVQFLQLTEDPYYLFRLREKIALRIKEPEAIVNLYPPVPAGQQPPPPPPPLEETAVAIEPIDED